MKYYNYTTTIQLNTKLDNTLFCDIETTGLSSKNHHIYLIGAGEFTNDTYTIHQWFAENKNEEAAILKAFSDFVSSYSSIITFNGEHFDIPFINARCLLYDINPIPENIKSIDLYKLIRPYRDILKLPNVRQKTVEVFLGINRDDEFDGGRLINVYKEYVKKPDDLLLNQLILHNHDDMEGLARIFPINNYIMLLNGCIDITSVTYDLHTYTDYDGIENTEIFFTATLPVNFPASFSNNAGPYSIHIRNNILKICVRLFSGELKFFFDNYKDYYYLPDEDTAMHRSVAQYVDKSHRCKATADNCYIRKISSFLPQEEELFTPVFKSARKDHTSFFEPDDSFVENINSQKKYLKYILKWQKGLPG